MGEEEEQVGRRGVVVGSVLLSLSVSMSLLAAAAAAAGPRLFVSLLMSVINIKLPQVKVKVMM